jgi:hypothetical protein
VRRLTLRELTAKALAMVPEGWTVLSAHNPLHRSYDFWVQSPTLTSMFRIAETEVALRKFQKESPTLTSMFRIAETEVACALDPLMHIEEKVREAITKIQKELGPA